jgi:hypothetical protein
MNDSKVKKLENAGIRDAKKLPPQIVDALARLSDDELKAIVTAKDRVGTLEDFGGIIF